MSIFFTRDNLNSILNFEGKIKTLFNQKNSEVDCKYIKSCNLYSNEKRFRAFGFISMFHDE